MKNNLFFGIFIGAISPLIAFILAHYTMLTTYFLPEKPLAIYVVVGLINIFGARFIYRSGMENTAKGIMLSTFLAMIVMIILMRVKV